MVESENIMYDLGIGILAVQEMHRSYSEYFVADSGYFYILSGSDQDEREYAGVGFIVARSCRNYIVEFCAASIKMACLRMKCSKGKFAIFSAYAPTKIYPYALRQEYFAHLATFYKSVSVH